MKKFLTRDNLLLVLQWLNVALDIHDSVRAFIQHRFDAGMAWALCAILWLLIISLRAVIKKTVKATNEIVSLFREHIALLERHNAEMLMRFKINNTNKN